MNSEYKSKINLNLLQDSRERGILVSLLWSNTSSCSLFKFFSFYSLPLGEYFSNFSGHQSTEGLDKPQGLLKPYPRDSDSGGLGKGLRICISSKFSGDADVANYHYQLYFKN